MVTQDQLLLKNRYIVGDVLGQGGMAAVHRAHDTSLGRDVAIKLFPPVRDEALLRQQETEVTVLATLSHHGLVSLFDAGIDRRVDGHDRVFLVMELVEGVDLQRRIFEGTLIGRNVGQIGYDLAEALQYIHHRGVVHRDVKPSNVLFVDYSDDSTRARVKLTDFGIARRVGDAVEPAGASTTGTAAYLSPEQVLREEVGPPSDVYSLGLVLLECFTGVIAFPGDPTESALARIERDPHIPETITPQWREVLAAMTNRDPASRPVANDLVLAMRALTVMEMGRHSAEPVIDGPPDEAARLAAVRRYDVLDTPPDGAFDRITAMAARILETPIAIVSIVDTDRIWFASRYGIDVEQIDREPGLCSSAIMFDQPWVVTDARYDPRVLANPLVAGEFGLQFYAGVPLRTRDGHNLGTLCVIDFEPREISDDQVKTLEDLAALAMTELELRLETRRSRGLASAS